MAVNSLDHFSLSLNSSFELLFEALSRAQAFLELALAGLKINLSTETMAYCFEILAKSIRKVQKTFLILEPKLELFLDKMV